MVNIRSVLTSYLPVFTIRLLGKFKQVIVYDMQYITSPKKCITFFHLVIIICVTKQTLSIIRCYIWFHCGSRFIPIIGLIKRSSFQWLVCRQLSTLRNTPHKHSTSSYLYLDKGCIIVYAFVNIESISSIFVPLMKIIGGAEEWMKKMPMIYMRWLMIWWFLRHKWGIVYSKKCKYKDNKYFIIIFNNASVL